jgi:hypothetical protein
VFFIRFSPLYFDIVRFLLIYFLSLGSKTGLWDHRNDWSDYNAFDIYSGGFRFESQLLHGLYCLRIFIDSLSFSSECLDSTSIRPWPLPSKSFQFLIHLLFYNSTAHRVSQEGRSIFCEVTVSAILSKKGYIYMCPIPNGFRDRAISLYSTVLYTVQTSNTPCPHTSCKVHW